MCIVYGHFFSGMNTLQSDNIDWLFLYHTYYDAFSMYSLLHMTWNVVQLWVTPSTFVECLTAGKIAHLACPQKTLFNVEKALPDKYFKHMTSGCIP